MSEAKLSFPFWMISEQRHILNPPENVPCDSPFAVHAFSTTEKLSAFLEAHKGGRWSIDLVANQNELVMAVADLHAKNVPGFCVDPKPDGSEGELISLADALKTWT